MGEALRTISFKVRTASCGGTACVNSFGDEQLAVDMLADKLLFEVGLRLFSTDNGLKKIFSVFKLGFLSLAFMDDII